MNKTRPVVRMCAVSRQKLEREQLFRVVKTKEGVFFDPTYKMQGRGVYIKKDLAVIKTAHDRKLLSRALKSEVNEDIFITLIENLSKWGD